MAGETQEAAIGYGGEFHLHNGTTLYELQQVKEFDIPEPGQRARVEKTHLKSANFRKEYILGLYEDTEFEVVLNFRPLSDTEILLSDARNDGDVRPFKAVIAEDGVPFAQVTGTAECIGFKPGRITVEGLTEATATFRVVSVTAFVVYSA